MIEVIALGGRTSFRAPARLLIGANQTSNSPHRAYAFDAVDGNYASGRRLPKVGPGNTMGNQVWFRGTLAPKKLWRGREW
jgi:hypothetical protein